MELAGNTAVRVDDAGSGVRVDLESGSVAFSSRTSATMRIRVETYEIVAGPGAAGEVTRLAGNRLGVAALAGTLAIRSRQAQQEPVSPPPGETPAPAPDDETGGEADGQVNEGERVLIPLDAAAEPAAAEVAGTGVDAGGLGTGAWVGIGVGGVAGGALGAYLATRQEETRTRTASPSRP
jgi:hypothetical protein